MKKLIAMAFCFILGVSVLSGCGGSDEKKQTNTTTTPNSITTQPVTQNTTPSTDASQPSTIPDNGYMTKPNGNGDMEMPNNSNSGSDMGGIVDNGSGQSRTQSPISNGRNR